MTNKVKNKRVTLKLYKGIYPVYNNFTKPKVLTKCKYEIVTYGRVRKSVTTTTFNREVVIKHICQWATDNEWIRSNSKTPIPYIIYVTENNGQRELLIDSTYSPHIKFMKFLCQPEVTM